MGASVRVAALFLTDVQRRETTMGMPINRSGCDDCHI